jgi:hypothetical protein
MALRYFCYLLIHVLWSQVKAFMLHICGGIYYFVDFILEINCVRISFWSKRNFAMRKIQQHND